MSVNCETGREDGGDDDGGGDMRESREGFFSGEEVGEVEFSVEVSLELSTGGPRRERSEDPDDEESANHVGERRGFFAPPSSSEPLPLSSSPSGMVSISGGWLIEWGDRGCPSSSSSYSSS